MTELLWRMIAFFVLVGFLLSVLSGALVGG
jgi:F0F1-type ATP synthase membrane subunit b/b'